MDVINVPLHHVTNLTLYHEKQFPANVNQKLSYPGLGYLTDI